MGSKLPMGFDVSDIFERMLLKDLGSTYVIVIRNVICLPSKHLGVLKNSLKCVHSFRIKLDFENC